MFRVYLKTRRHDVWTMVTIVASLVLWFLPYLRHGYMFLSEAGQMLWADWLMSRRMFFAFEDPSEWNPYVLFGINWAGVEAFYNPLNVGSLVGVLIPGDKFAFMLVTAAFLGLMGFAIYLFLRALGIRPAFARIGLVVYLLAPKWLDDVYHGPRFVVGYAVLPLILLLILRMYAARFRSFLHFIVLALLGSVSYLGLGAAFGLIQLYVIASFFCFMWYRCWREHGDAGVLFARTVACLAVSAATFVALSAYALLPFILNYLASARSTYGEPTGFMAADYLGLIFPWANRIFGRGLYDLPYPPVLPILVPNVGFYVGILAIPVLAIGFARRLWTPVTGFFAVTFVAWLALWNAEIKAVVPILPWLERLTHGEASQYHGHIILILSMSVVIAAGLQAMVDRRETIWQGRAGRYLGWLNRLLITMYLAAAAVFAVGALVFGTGLKEYFWSRITVGHFLFFHYYLQEMAMMFIAIFLLRAAIVWIYHRRHFETGWGIAALLVLTVADFQLVLRTVYPFTDLDARYDSSRMPNSFVLDHTEPLDRIGASQFQVDGASKADRLNALVAMPAPHDYADVVDRFGEIYYEGFKKPLYEPSFNYFPVAAQRSFYGFHESLMPAYFWDFDRALNQGHPRYERGSWIGLWDPHSRLLDVAGIKYLFWHEPVNDPRFVEVGRYHNQSRVYLNSGAVPRSYVVSRIEHYPSRQDLLHRLGAESFRPRETVTTEDRELFDVFQASAPSAEAGHARIERYNPNHVTVRIATPQQSVLVLNDMFHPNWTARIDGKESKIYRVNGIFRGLVVPAGDSIVEFNYRDRSFHMGLGISGSAWFAVGLFFGGAWWKARRSRVMAQEPTVSEPLSA